MYYIIWYHNYHISISILHSLLVFAQRQSNQRLAFFMVFSFYIECILGNSLLLLLYKPNFDIGYWISTAHPFSRLPVFFMGVCAGVLCMRIKEQDFDAMNCKLVVNCIFYCCSVGFDNALNWILLKFEFRAPGIFLMVIVITIRRPQKEVC